MKNLIVVCVVAVALTRFAGAADEKPERIRGTLEKTAKAGAITQITDALSETYYIAKSDEAEKAIANFVGKPQKVVVTGRVETKEGDPAYFIHVKSVEAYVMKTLPAPPVPSAPPKVEEKKPEEPKVEKKEEKK